MKELRALIVEDSTDDAELLLLTLARAGYEVTHCRVQTTAEMETALRGEIWDIVFSDWSMPQFEARGALTVLQNSGIDIPFIMVSGTVGEEVVVAALRSGAHDFFSKDNLVLLPPAIERELREAGIRQEKARIQEQLLAQTVDLQKANDLLSHQLELKNMFITAVSHELRTPLTGIIGATSELAHRWSEFTENDRKELVEMAHTQSVELSALVEDLLTAGRMGAGTLSVLPEPVAVDVELRRVVNSLENVVSPQVTTGAGTVTVMADPIRLRQIIRNLLLNAARHGGPEIRVTVGSDGDRALVRIADNGPEIPEKERSLMFEPFYGANPSGGLAPSVGLGLTISRNLAHMMEGNLSYVYEDGWGVFVLDLPGA